MAPKRICLSHCFHIPSLKKNISNIRISLIYDTPTFTYINILFNNTHRNMPEKREREEIATDRGLTSSDQEAEFLHCVEEKDAILTEDDVESSTANRSSSAAVTPPPKAAINSSASGPKHVFSPELLSQYYKRLFPFDLLHSWLSYSCPPNNKGEASSNTPQTTFTHREFSFTIEPVPGEEIYIRYQSFLNQAELTQAVHRRNPHKIDIGAVFSHPPKDHLTIQGSSQRSFHPVQRELVFDVDLTDYDGVRRCGCGGADICSKCWKMMTMAVKVMDSGLKEDFGFKNVAWFYSGRRGIHAWICDESARTLSDAGRSAVASYFEVRCTSLVPSLLCHVPMESIIMVMDDSTCIVLMEFNSDTFFFV